MSLARRQVLQISALLPLALPVSSVLALNNIEATSALAFTYFEIRDEIAAPLFHQGDHVLIDQRVSHFAGEGFYLYPNWGQPRLYRVKQLSEGTLGFYLPGKEGLLWSMTTNSTESLFAGSPVSMVKAGSERELTQLVENYTKLDMPILPA